MCRLNSQWVNEEVKENKKFLETSKNRNITSQNLCICSGEKTISSVNIGKSGQLHAKE